MNKPLPVRAHGRAGHCPACDRFIGPVSECPYCENPSRGVPALRLLHIGAVLLAGLGLGFLSLAARHREIPLVKIADISARMNRARVRIEGKVAADAYIGYAGETPDYLSFRLVDGTGSIRVAVYGAAVEDLIHASRVPDKGAWLSASGDLDLSARHPMRLRMQSAGQLTFLPEPVPAPLHPGEGALP